MTKYLCKIVPVLLVMVLLANSGFAGGLIFYEIGTADVGLASAGYAARAQDAGTLATNPAGMTRIQGSEFLLGTQALYGDAEFSQDANTTVSGDDGGNLLGLIPMGSAFYVNEINPDLKWGVGLFANFGLEYEYNESWAGRYFTTEGGLSGITVMPGIAYRLNEQLSLGVALNIKYGRFETKSAVNTFLPGDGNLEYEDDTFGYGANFGVLYEVSETTRFGVTYYSKVSLEFEDSLSVSDLAIIGTLKRNLEVELEKPQTLMASFYHGLNDKWAMLGSVGWEDWSSFGKIGFQVDTIPASSFTSEVDRNYNDVWHGAVGTQYRYSDDWLFSCGVAYDSSMVDDEYRTVDLPVGDMWRLGIGGQYQWSKDLQVGIGYSLVLEGDLIVNQQKRSVSGGTETLSGVYEDVMLHFFTVNFIW